MENDLKMRILLNMATNKNHFGDYGEAIRYLITIIDLQEEKIKKLESEVKKNV